MAERVFPDEWLVPTISGMITPEAVDALRAAAEPASTLWELTTLKGYATDEQILEAMSKRFRVPVADPAQHEPKVKEIIPEAVARRYHVVPLRATDTVLEVGAGTGSLTGLIAARAGAVVAVSQLTRGYPGIENPGQPLYGARMECMTPPQAAAFLAAHGYTDVVWQVESGEMVRVSDGGAEGNAPKGPNTSVQQSTAPEHGYVIPGSVLDDGRLHMVVDRRVGASGVGECFGMPMP